MKSSSDLRPPGSFLILDEEDMKKLQEGKAIYGKVMDYKITLFTEEGFKNYLAYWKE